MIELKLKNNGTFTLKGLSEDHLNTINALVAHVRLGMGTVGSEAAFELGQLFENEGFDIDEVEVNIVREVPEEDVTYTIELY